MVSLHSQTGQELMIFPPQYYVPGLQVQQVLLFFFLHFFDGCCHQRLLHLPMELGLGYTVLEGTKFQKATSNQ